MARKTTTSTLRRVRRALLFGLLLFVTTLTGLYLFGRRAPGGPRLADREENRAGPEVKIIGNEFRYEVSEGGERLFNIEADRLLSDEADLFILEGVKITTQRENDAEYTITAERGSYRLDVNEASMEGDVVLTGSGGLSLWTEGLELRRRGKVVVSSAPVRLALGETYRGRANKLEVVFPRNRIVLAGRVELDTAPGVYPRASLRARRTLFFRDTHNFLAEGNVEFRRESDRLEALRLSLNFDELDRKVLFARASWEVEATIQQLAIGGMPSTAKATGDDLSVVFNEVTGDPERLELAAPEGGRARLEVTDASALQRSIDSNYLWAEFVQGRLRRAQGLGAVVVEEGLSFAPQTMLRQICSDSADVVYDAGGALTDLSLDGDVAYNERGMEAGGDRLATLGDTSQISLTGELAWVANPDGRLSAPQISVDRKAGRAQATGGVRAEMRQASGPELAVEDGADQPVRVEARSASWNRETRHFGFRENVRAWQGENFLVSQSLEMQGAEMLADGGVRSVWHERTAPAQEDADRTSAEPPVTIAASRMRYHRGEKRLVYEGNSQVVQGGRSMSCPLLQVQMDAEDHFERMYCEGGTQIEDDEGGSKITGDAAIYNTEAAKVKVLGDPVRLEQNTGGTISARLMVYDFVTAIAEIDSVKPEDADLFMTATEYYQQFGGAAVPAVPAAPAGTPEDEPGEAAAAGDAGEAIGEETAPAPEEGSEATPEAEKEDGADGGASGIEESR